MDGEWPPTPTFLGDDEQPVVTQTVLQSIVYVTQTVTASSTPQATQPPNPDGDASSDDAKKGLSQGKLAGVIGGSFVAGLILTIIVLYVMCLVAARASARAKERRSNYRRPRRHLTIGRHGIHRNTSSSGQTDLLARFKRRSEQSREPTIETKVTWPTWAPLPIQRARSPPTQDKESPSARPRNRLNLNLRPSSAPGGTAPRLPLTSPLPQQGGPGSVNRSGWRHTVFEALLHAAPGDSNSSNQGHADWRNPPPFVSVVNCDTYRRPPPEQSVTSPLPSLSEMPLAPGQGLPHRSRSMGSSAAPSQIPVPPDERSPLTSKQGSIPTPEHVDSRNDGELARTQRSRNQSACPERGTQGIAGWRTPTETGTINTMTGEIRHLLRVVGQQRGAEGDSLGTMGSLEPREHRTPRSSHPSQDAGTSARSHRRSHSTSQDPPIWWTRAMQSLVPGALQERIMRGEQGRRGTSFELLGSSHEGGWSTLDPAHRMYPTSLMLAPTLNKSLPLLDTSRELPTRRPSPRKAKSMDGLGSALREQFDVEPGPELQQTIDEARRSSRFMSVDDAAIVSVAASTPGSPACPTHPHQPAKSRHPSAVDLAAALAKTVAASLTGRKRERDSSRTIRQSAGPTGGSQGRFTPLADEFYNPNINFTELELGLPSSSGSDSRPSTPTLKRVERGKGRYEALAPSSPNVAPMDRQSMPPGDGQNGSRAAKGGKQAQQRPARVVRSISMDELTATPLLLLGDPT